jgi:hypothetical protein
MGFLLDRTSRAPEHGRSDAVLRVRLCCVAALHTQHGTVGTTFETCSATLSRPSDNQKFSALPIDFSSLLSTILRLENMLASKKTAFSDSQSRAAVAYEELNPISKVL